MANAEGLLDSEEKELLLSRYADLEFLEADDECRCGRCQRVMIHHYFSQCGHAFCKNCKNMTDDGSGKWRCKQCGDFIKQISEQRLEMEIKVNNLKTFCPNKKYGCPFENSLNNIAKHLKSCKNTHESALPVEITRGKNIDAVFRKLFELNMKFDTIINKMKKMEEKIETMDNKNCSLETEIRNLQEVHKKNESLMNGNQIALQKVLKKGNARPRNGVSKTDLNNRLKEFKEELKDDKNEINKKFESEITLKSLEEQVKTHQNLLTEEIDQSKEEMKKISREFQELKNDIVNNKKDKEATIARETQIAENMKKIEGSFNSKTETIEETLLFKEIQINVCSVSEVDLTKWKLFQWIIPDLDPIGFRQKTAFRNLKSFNVALDVQLLFTSTYGLLKLCSKNDEATQKKVKKLNVFPRVFFSIKDESKNDGEKVDILKSNTQLLYSPSYKSNVFYNVSIDRFPILAPKYKIDNKMEIDIYVEPMSVANHFYSKDGILRSKIVGYREKKKREAEGQMEGQLSPYFYTSDMGHRVQAELKLHGKNEQQQNVLTVWLLFLPGQFKPTANWSKKETFHHKTTVTIYNQKNPSKHMLKSVRKVCKNESDWASKYSLEFPLSAKNLNSGFTTNDTLYYKIEIIQLEA